MRAIEEIDLIKPVCPTCETGMVKNRGDPLGDGYEAHYWICRNHAEHDEDEQTQRKVPYKTEWQKLKSAADDKREEGSHVLILKLCSIGDE